MNKTISLGIAAFLAASGVASALDGSYKEPVEEIVDEELENFMPEPILVYTLSLDDAIEYGLNSDFSLMELDYTLKNLESLKAGAEADYEDLQDTVEDLEDTMDRLRKIQRELGQRTFQERYAIQEQIKQLEEYIEEIEDAIEEMEKGQIVPISINQEEAEEAIKLQIISQFMTLKMTEEQLQFTKQTLATQEERVAHLKRQYELGVIPRTDYDVAKRELTSLESQIAQTEDQLVHDTAVFALNIGIEYHPDLTLEKPMLDDQLELVEQTIPTEELIEQSFAMKAAQANLAWAREQRDKVYEDEDSTEHEREQADIAVEVELMNISKLRVDSQNAINELYANVEQQYRALKDAENEVAYAEEDFEHMKQRYKIGVISKADYELSEINLTQASFNYEMEKYTYFLLLQQVALLEAGVIPINM